MKYIISFLSLILFLGLVFFYLQISKPEKEINIKKDFKNKVVENKDENLFKIKQVNTIELPVRVLYMKIDFQKHKFEVIYKVSIKNVDKYALFNIKEILDAYNVAYSMIKEKNTEIYIFFKSLTQAERVLKLFKEYNFNIKIQKIKKRI